MEDNKILNFENELKLVQEKIEEIKERNDNYRNAFYARHSGKHFTSPTESVRRNLEDLLPQLMEQFPGDIRESQEFRLEVMKLVMPVAMNEANLSDNENAIKKAIKYCPAAINVDYYDKDNWEWESPSVFEQIHENILLEVLNENPEVIKHMPQTEKASSILLEAITTNQELLELDFVKEYIDKYPELNEKVSKMQERKAKEQELKGLMEEKCEIDARIAAIGSELGKNDKGVNTIE